MGTMRKEVGGGGNWEKKKRGERGLTRERVAGALRKVSHQKARTNESKGVSKRWRGRLVANTGFW